MVQRDVVRPLVGLRQSVVSVGVADIHREPDPASELITQALMNAPAEIDERVGTWMHVRLADYEGWITSDALEEPAGRVFCKVGETCHTPLQLSAVITATHTPLYADSFGNDTLETVYLSTALSVLDMTDRRRVQVALPGERTAWLARSAVVIRQSEESEALYPSMPLRTVTDYARAFLNVPYLWGGTTYKGIDCSGFVQLCYRMGGSILPRDSYQQHDALHQSIERAEMRKGDLIFFGEKRITHVAMALNAWEYIHAEGQQYNHVVINSFNPADAHYYPRLDKIVWAIKRVKGS